MSTFKFSAIIGTLGQLSDRYMGCGYKESDISYHDALKELKEMDILTGIELTYAPHGELSNAAYVREELDHVGFVPTYVNSSLFGERIWANGSLTNKDSAIRERAISMVLKGLDFTKAVGAKGYNLWLGQDGFDYPFQTDYTAQWEYLVSALKIIADYNQSLEIAIEPKLREPRNRSIIDTVSTGLLLCSEAGSKNLGLTIDVGHVMQAGQNIAQQIELAAHQGRLFNMHVNDNYGVWDDDMIVGSVHLIEYLEMVFALKKVGYPGWISVDIFPFREDSFKATRECINQVQKFEDLVELLGFDKLRQLIGAGETTETMKYIRETIFK